ncbi:hypothetical protein [Marilutibacter maris]|uniref:hypothetical protein n=1 Tax=Marilutibacter maris TaxID=1605891 RepID=UPI000DAA96CD|nr:hypothetical protein [Lysobacter maris]
MIRLILVAFSVPAWLVIRAAMPDDFSQAPQWHFPFIVVGFTAFGVVAWRMFHSDMEWKRPRWSASPFNWSTPLEGIHLSGWSFIAGGLGLLVANLFAQAADWAWVLPGSVGLGFLVGAHVVATGDAPDS